MEKSLQCTAYNGRYLMMGFASNKVVADEPFIVPRRIALGTSSCAACCSRTSRPEMAEMLKTAMGWNFVPAELGEKIMREIVELVARRRRSSPSSARRSSFEDIPAAIEAMANRETIGRTIVML